MDTKLITDFYGMDREYSFYACVGGQPGYGWVFPKQHTVNVGLGVVGPHSRGLSLKFRSFLRMLERKEMIPNGSHNVVLRGALVPTGGPVPRSFCDRCLLVGDSAGMVNPLTGGGIAYSMRAGRYAAAVLSDCIESQIYDASSLSRYEHLWREDFGKEMKRLLVAQRLFTSPFVGVMFHIGSRDSTVQAIVAEAMAKSHESQVDLRRLGTRVLYVCLREALHAG
jgi:flavin-dependent dehydrogenase